jgi:hypothetical protein
MVAVSEALYHGAAYVGRARLGVDRRALGVAAGLTLATLLLRLPSLFEPPWHTDEGIFAAVAYRVLQGGDLYADVWESKPPLFLFLYVAIFKLFGVGVLPLHLAATAAAIGSQWALYGIACRFMSRRRALIASFVCALLLGVPFWEGQLALTEVFALLPTTLAVLCVLTWDARRSATSEHATWLLAAGLLFGVAFLLRQTTAIVCLAVVLWLLLSGRQWLRPAMLLALGAGALTAVTIAGFALFGSLHWFWDANVGFFFHYVPSGRETPFHYRPLIVLPVLVACACMVWYRRRGETPVWGLAVLWLTLSLAAALLTGRPYSHYFLQIIPPLALLVALIAPHIRFSWRPHREHLPALALAASVLALWFGVVAPQFQGNLLAMHYTKSLDYYANFAGWSIGLKDDKAYQDYFDKRVYLTLRLEDKLDQLAADGESVYIWGEYPWVYPLAEASPVTRYATSFYVLLIPYLDTQLHETLATADPRFIVVLPDAWPRMADDTGVLKRRYENATRAVNGLIAHRYEQVATVGRARVFERVPERPLVRPIAATNPLRD